MLIVKALVADGAVLSRYFSGFIGAVVRHHKDRNKLFRIVLLRYAVKQIAYDLFLVAGGYHHSVFMVFLCRLEFTGIKEAYNAVNDFICNNRRKNRADNCIYNFKRRIPIADTRSNISRLRYKIKKQLYYLLYVVFTHSVTIISFKLHKIKHKNLS